jgi:hypothetical protein
MTSQPATERRARRSGMTPEAVRRRVSVPWALGIIIGVAALGGCTPPTEVVDLRATPPETWYAMQHMPVIPVGLPALVNAGSIGQIAGYGCGQTPDSANLAAVQQLQIKALRMRATAVTDVVIQTDGLGPCLMPYSVIAKGLAMAPRGIPPTY